MGLFSSLKEGDTLMQMFAGSDNPAAEHLLSDTEVNAMRGRLAFGESIKAFARGRVVSKGKGFWLLTSEAIFVFGEAAYPYRMAFSQVESIAAEQGQYGLTLRLRVQGASYAVFGVSPRLGLGFARMLAHACGIQAQGLEGSLSGADVECLLYLFKDAALRIDPVGSLIQHQPQVWKQWLDQSVEDGMVLASDHVNDQAR
ncbi:MAG: hypothetical protein EBZ04_02750 [Betaproteobacteria bacterium]|nr:hypothetical protein [Betaproteobacteria bacterium]